VQGHLKCFPIIDSWKKEGDSVNHFVPDPTVVLVLFLLQYNNYSLTLFLTVPRNMMKKKFQEKKEGKFACPCCSVSSIFITIQ
jgi:hypothetical protein